MQETTALRRTDNYLKKSILTSEKILQFTRARDILPVMQKWLWFHNPGHCRKYIEEFLTCVKKRPIIQTEQTEIRS